MTEAEDGWLSPEGVFHEVDFEGHEYYAESLGHDNQEALYKLQWVKLSGRAWLGDNGWNQSMLVTQRQFDFIYDYHTANDRTWNPDKYQLR